MRFDKNRKPPPYLSRREQYRMLALVGALCLVLLAIQWAANPDNWRWFTDLEQGPGPATAEDPPPALDEIDFRALPVDDGPLPPGVFRADFGAEPDGREAPPPDEFDPTSLPPDLLADVKDNQLGHLRREQPVMTFVIDRVRTLDAEAIDAAAIDDIAFTVLMQRPDDYRGRILRISGTLRQLEPYTGPGSDQFSPGVYEGWMFSATSDNNPYRVFVTELPPDFPTGTELDVPVEFTGYFYRLFGYLTQNGDHVAPMLIGKTLQMRPGPAGPDPTIGEDLSRFVLVFLSVVGVAFGLLLWRFVVSDRRFRNSRMQRLAESRLDAREEDISAIAEMEVVDPERMFEDLEES